MNKNYNTLDFNDLANFTVDTNNTGDMKVSTYLGSNIDSLGPSFHGSGGQAASFYCDSYSWYRDYYRPWADTTTVYHSYPVVRYEDDYKKAFEIAKYLLKEKLLVSNRLPDFISLVEKIANLL